VPVYLLYDAARADRISRMALGLRHPRAQVIPYGPADAAVGSYGQTSRAPAQRR